MAGSTYGTIFKITTWGESHGKALGVVIDGCPAGIDLSEADIQVFLDRRKPGQNKISTPRKEDDCVEILSGIFEGKTTGTPISMMVKNTAQISKDYTQIASYFRPGHADYTFESKYGFRDYRGGGRSSGRETIGRVAAGALAAKILTTFHINISAYTLSIGPIHCDPNQMDLANIHHTPTGMPDLTAASKANEYIHQMMEKKDSVGGIIECRVSNMPIGLGEPVFEKLDANLAKALMSIGAIKAVEIGDGVLVSEALGSENNDNFCITAGEIKKETNHSGGILGGISDGSDLIIRAHVKPTPSIFSSQKTVTKNGEEIMVEITGRHDPIILPRALVVVESMVALTLLDALLLNTCSTMEHLSKIYLS